MSTQKKTGFRIDSMALLLTALFVFIIGGTIFTNCGGSASGNSSVVTDEDRKNGIVVAIDPAFGGELTGYEGIMNEADFNEKVADALVEKLSENKRITVLRTHEAGETASVDEKVEVIKEAKATVVLTICCAKSNNANTSGMNIYADKPTSEFNENSLKFAECIKQQFTEEDEKEPYVGYMYYEPVGGNTYQIKYAKADDTTDYELETYRILEKSNTVGVVVEQIYITNEEQVNRWATEEGYNEIAERYYKAIKDYLGV